MIARNTVAAKPAKPKKCRCGCGAFSPTFAVADRGDPWNPQNRAQNPKDAAESEAGADNLSGAKGKAKRTSDLKPQAQSAINAYRRQSDIKASYGCIGIAGTV